MLVSASTHGGSGVDVDMMLVAEMRRITRMVSNPHMNISLGNKVCKAMMSITELAPSSYLGLQFMHLQLPP